MKTHNIAIIKGDGIGHPVVDAAWEVLRAAAKQSGFALNGTEMPWSCAHY